MRCTRKPHSPHAIPLICIGKKKDLKSTSNLISPTHYSSLPHRCCCRVIKLMLEKLPILFLSLFWKISSKLQKLLEIWWKVSPSTFELFFPIIITITEIIKWYLVLEMKTKKSNLKGNIPWDPFPLKVQRARKEIQIKLVFWINRR